MQKHTLRTKTTGLALTALLVGGGISATVASSNSSVLQARHGADDPAGHIRGEGPGHLRNGADDPAGHIRGEGPGHR
jgi:hypothetical protein